MTTTSTTSSRISLSRRTIAVSGATIGAVLVWLVETRPLGVDLAVRVGDGTQPITAVAAAATALVAGLAGAATAWLLTRLAPRRSRTLWTVLSSTVLLLSLLGPLGGSSAPAVVALLSLHLLVGLTLIIGLRPARQPAGGYGE